MLPLKDPLLIFTLMVIIILVAPLLAARWRMPDLVLLLIAGTLLGPNALNVLEHNTAISLFASVGLIYILFLAGLEIDLHRFVATRQRSLTFGMLTFLIPQLLGTLAGRYVLGLDWRASVLLASMFASHTLLAYPIASRMGITRSEPVSVTVSATIVTDTLALLVLAVIADSARGAELGVGFWFGLVLGMVLLLLLIWYGIPRLTHWFFHRVSEAGGAQFLFVLGTVCVFSYLSHYARMEPIIGAFLAGAAFNRLIPEHSTLMNRVVFVGNNLFIPFFLVSVGMLVDPMAFMGSPRTWLVALTMVCAVIVTKYLAAWISAKWFGYDTASRQVMFGLSVVQAAATLAAVLVGFELKIFDASILNGTIMMIAITCPLGAWLVDRYGRIMQQQQHRHAPPAPRGQRLLVALTNPETAPPILDLVFVLRKPASPGSIHALTVVKDEENTENGIARGENLMSHCLTRAAAAAIPLEPLVRVDANPADGIVRAAKELHTTTVIIGWRGDQALGDRFFGTVSMHLLNVCGSRLLFSRLTRPLGTCKRLLLLWHPLVEYRSDLHALLDDTLQLSDQLGLHIRVFAVGEASEELQKRLDGMVPPRPWSLCKADSLGMAQERLLSEVVSGDILLLPCERRSDSLWTPAFDRLPDRVVARFPENNLLVAYPNISGEWDVPLSISIEPQVPPITILPVILDTELSVEAALGTLAKKTFGADALLAADAWRLLGESAREYPVELCDGVVLVHGHCEMTYEPAIMIARSPVEWELRDVREPFQILIALISPKVLSPSQHLDVLKRLADTFRTPETRERIEKATSTEVIRQIITKGMSRE